MNQAPCSKTGFSFGSALVSTVLVPLRDFPTARRGATLWQNASNSFICLTHPSPQTTQ